MSTLQIQQIVSMASIFLYVVDRDFGFAPNPFHGYCSLATCKPKIRNSAVVGDWIFGLGGKRLGATGKCIFAMKVTNIITFNEYWNNPLYNDKKPVRNGSKKMVLGDNIYHYDDTSNSWFQAFSHHSNIDGSLNEYNLKRDTTSKNVLLSTHFYYFGKEAPTIPKDILRLLKYKNGVGHRKYNSAECSRLLKWLEDENHEKLNIVFADPYNFDQSGSHYTVQTNKIITTSR